MVNHHSTYAVVLRLALKPYARVEVVRLPEAHRLGELLASSRLRKPLSRWRQAPVMRDEREAGVWGISRKRLSGECG